MTPLVAMFIPALVASLGGLLAVYWSPSHQMRSLIQHFAAGVVLAALAVEVLPEISREHAPAWVIIGAFTLGVVMMYIMKLWSMRLEAQEANSQEGESFN